MAMRKREDEVFPKAAGIDIGASSHWIAVPRHLATSPPGSRHFWPWSENSPKK